MSQFIYFRDAVNNKLKEMASSEATLFRANISKDEMWDIYLRSFPEGSNPIFRERTEHDCNCCKQFIRACGGIVTVDPRTNKLVSIWDVVAELPYQAVADEMSEAIKASGIANVFTHDSPKAGAALTHSQEEDGSIANWEHFYTEDIPQSCVKSGDFVGTLLSQSKARFDVFNRGLNEITYDALDMVEDLIKQGSLYRGEEFKTAVQHFKKEKKKYEKVTSSRKDNYLWERSVFVPAGLATLRNSVIGTLLVDLSEGKDLEYAVKAFETKVAPQNYKRPTALITPRMIEEAQKKIEQLGLGDSLERRFAVPEDVSVNNVLFADRDTQKVMKEGSVFDDLKQEASGRTPRNLKKVEEIHIDQFVEDVLPKINKMELMLENKHENNLMSVIAPVNPDAANMLKWDNNFSWSYKGEVTDSIKERVKAAGGNVEGYLRCSLSWSNYDDLDIHMFEPMGGEHIHYGFRKSHGTFGNLDVDMNARHKDSRTPVENIVYPTKSRMIPGVYKLKVHNFRKRENKDVGFTVEIECEGQLYTFEYGKAMRDMECVTVAELKVDKNGEVTVIGKLPSTTRSKELWGVNTNTFVPVAMMMHSPNHWDDNQVGNKHTFFVLEDCLNPEPARGFYNEFLKAELNDHRKVFEVLASKMKAEPTERQLSGVGFSSTQRNTATVKVSGSFNRMLKIIF